MTMKTTLTVEISNTMKNMNDFNKLLDKYDSDAIFMTLEALLAEMENILDENKESKTKKHKKEELPEVMGWHRMSDWQKRVDDETITPEDVLVFFIPPTDCRTADPNHYADVTSCFALGYFDGDEVFFSSFVETTEGILPEEITYFKPVTAY